MHQILRKAQSKGVDFASIRHEVGRVLGITADEDTERVDISVLGFGYMLRVVSDGNVVDRFTTRETTASDVEEALRLRLRPGEDRVPSMPPLRDSYVVKPTPNLNKAPEDKMADLKELRDFVLESTPLIRNIDASYYEVVVEKEYFDTNGREITQSIPNSSLIVTATAGTPGNMATAFVPAATTRGYVFDLVSMETLRDNIARKLDAKLKGISVDAGEYRVVLGPEAVGTFCHEAVGHLAEVDYRGEQGLLLKERGKKIAIGSVSIVDAPTVDTLLSGCSMKYDDEGTEAMPVRIVDSGVVEGFLTDLLQSVRLNLPPTGNARAQDVTVPAVVRMRNTYMERGDIAAEELISSIKHGYLIVDTSGGRLISPMGVSSLE